MRIETDKIRQVIRLLNLKYSQRETAQQVGISRATLKLIYDKLQLFPISNSELNLFTNAELLEYFEISRVINYPPEKSILTLNT